MTNADIQRLLAAAGYYNGAIDGILGPVSRRGIDAILDRRKSEASSDPSRWSQQRRAVGAAQLILKHAGYPVGAIDGYVGNLTRTAFLLWNSAQAGIKVDLSIPTVTPAPTNAQNNFPRQSGVNQFYGTPGPGGTVERNLVMMDLPVAMRIDWNLNQRSTRVQLHSKCVPSARAAMEEILRHYGEARWRQLGLDRNAGTYNPRKMRGSNSWSMHAYGCAWDFYAAPNGLTTRCPQALFCKEDYKAFFDIWERHGWLSLGRAIGRDWMHIQAARL